jgi:Family of unknown function (DUF5681)
MNAPTNSPVLRRISPKSLKNLAKGNRFQKGQTGNAGGRPKTKAIRQFLLDWLAVKEQGKTRQEKLVEHMAKHKPEIILYFAYGKPTEELEISARSSDVIEFKSAAELIRDLQASGSLDAAGHLIERE